MYHPFYSWGTNSKWNIPLPEGEDTQGKFISRKFRENSNKKSIKHWQYAMDLLE